MQTTYAPTISQHPYHHPFSEAGRTKTMPKTALTTGKAFRHRDRGVHLGRTKVMA